MRLPLKDVTCEAVFGLILLSQLLYCFIAKILFYRGVRHSGKATQRNADKARSRRDGMLRSILMTYEKFYELNLGLRAATRISGR